MKPEEIAILQANGSAEGRTTGLIGLSKSRRGRRCPAGADSELGKESD